MKRQGMTEICTPMKTAPHTNSLESLAVKVFRRKQRGGVSPRTGYVATLSFQRNPTSRGSLIARIFGVCKVAFLDGCRWLRERHQILTVIDHRSITPRQAVHPATTPNSQEETANVLLRRQNVPYDKGVPKDGKGWESGRGRYSSKGISVGV